MQSGTKLETRLRDEAAQHILEMTDDQIMAVHVLGKKILSHIEGQNFTDRPLTELEANLVLMTVAATYYDLMILPKGH